MIGKTLNHYQITALLGQGGMGEVYVAQDTKLGRRVALKTLPARVAADPDRRARFEREARAIAALNHPGIVTIHSVEQAGDVVFMTMELIDGKTLSEVIPAAGLSLQRFFELAIPLASALAAAHQKGITHRDLKPANIMVTTDGRVKVLDFGLAKLAEPVPIETDDSMLTATAAIAVTGEGRILGTVAYMSPEQAEGKAVDARSDVFALGIVMYQMATGERPFKGETPISTITSILRDTPVSIGELKPEMPRHLARVVQRCLAKEPERRYQTALDVRNELESLRSEIDSGREAVAASTSASDAVIPRRTARSRRPVVFAAVGLSAVALALAGAVLWPRLRGNAPPAQSAGNATTKSIAVLPFVNMSDEAGNDYFSDGLSEELLNMLAKVPGLKVAARTSSFHFKGTTGNVADIGRQLGVGTLLEGSVRRDGNRVRVTAELINADDGFQLWSETYDRQLDDIFAIQGSIAGEVVSALKIRLLGSDSIAHTTASRSTSNLEAYDAYLLGQQKMARRTSASIAEAAQRFQRAIELDPGYARAYVGLGDANLLLGDYSTVSQGDSLAKAEPFVRKALALDPSLGEAHASLGQIEVGKGNHAAAAAEFEKAIELSPNYSMAYTWYSVVLRRTDPERAFSLIQKALELDPLSPVVNCNVGHSLRQLGRPREAAERFRRAIEIEPGLSAAYGVLGAIYGDELNEPEECIRILKQGIAADPGSVRQRMWLAEDLVWLGRTDQAMAEYRAVLASYPQYAAVYVGLSDLAATQGNLAEALRWSQKAFDTDPGDPEIRERLFFRYLDVADVRSARDVVDREPAGDGDGPQARYLSYYLHLASGQLAEAEADAHWLVDRAPGYGKAVSWACDMRARRFAEARNRYVSSNPELFRDAAPVIRKDNLTAALNVAAAEMKLGNRDRATILLAQCEAYIASRDERTRQTSYRTEPVFINALLGKKDAAIEALRLAVDNGWRSGSWMFATDPRLDSIRDDVRFATIMQGIRPRSSE